MMSTLAKTIDTTINGIDAAQVMELAGKIQEVEGYGNFRFRAFNRWSGGTSSKTSIKEFFAGGQERSERAKPLFVAADQPDFLGGSNTAPNPVEHLLHALTSCLTTTLISHASVQQIVIDSIETSAEGELNSKGFFGISDEVLKGYERVRVTMRVGTQADVETLTNLAMNSPLFEMISKASKVEFRLLTIPS